MLRKSLKWVAAFVGLFGVWLAVVFVAAAVAADRVPISLSPGILVTGVGDSYVLANGTWVIEGQPQAFPLQTTEIRCERELRRCTSATAMVMLGKQLHVDISFHDVVSWEKSRVVFTDDSPSCVEYVYTIDLVTKVANGVRRKRTTPAVPAISDCGTFEQELHLSLKSGFSEVLALQKSAMPWFGEVALAPLRLFQ